MNDETRRARNKIKNKTTLKKSQHVGTVLRNKWQSLAYKLVQKFLKKLIQIDV